MKPLAASAIATASAMSGEIAFSMLTSSIEVGNGHWTKAVVIKNAPHTSAPTMCIAFALFRQKRAKKKAARIQMAQMVQVHGLVNIVRKLSPTVCEIVLESPAIEK